MSPAGQSPSSTEETVLLDFFKALADGNRLRLVGLLAHRPYSVEEISTVLELRPSTVSHHLSRLAAAQLVTSRAEGHYHVYSLDFEAIQDNAKSLLSTEGLQRFAATDCADPFDQKVLATFLDAEGRITTIPMKRKKFEVLLRYALRLFDDVGPWDEVEVNHRLKKITADTAAIRRGFIDHRMMVRTEGGREYRRLT